VDCILVTLNNYDNFRTIFQDFIIVADYINKLITVSEGNGYKLVYIDLQLFKEFVNAV